MVVFRKSEQGTLEKGVGAAAVGVQFISTISHQTK